MSSKGACIMNEQKVILIPVDQIHIPNPRVRNGKRHLEIAENIIKVGLKRPITIAKSCSDIEGKIYDLVCGQGRLEIFIAAKQSDIPAIVIKADEQEIYLKSLVENLARRHHSPMDLINGIRVLKDQDYGINDIAKKTGLSSTYIKDISVLIDNGEERLIAGVEKGNIPISLAATIAESSNDDQSALQEAYESGLLKGKRLLLAKEIIERRRTRGKTIQYGGGKRSGISRRSTAESVIKAYQENVTKKKILVRKSEMVTTHLMFINGALKKLYADDNFKTLLKAEGLDHFPKILSDQLQGSGATYHV
jgi:ParB family chromosome partitioning protein